MRVVMREFDTEPRQIIQLSIDVNFIIKVGSSYGDHDQGVREAKPPEPDSILLLEVQVRCKFVIR